MQRKEDVTVFYSQMKAKTDSAGELLTVKPSSGYDFIAFTKLRNLIFDFAYNQGTAAFIDSTGEIVKTVKSISYSLKDFCFF